MIKFNENLQNTMTKEKLCLGQLNFVVIHS